MEIAVLGFVAALVPLLALLAWVERRAARQEKEQALAQIAEAGAIGSARPLSQHPQIDPLRCVGCGLCVKACPEEEVLAVVDGVARVIHGARCVGHARCEAACPVGAIQVGLGELARRPDFPLLSPQQESSVPGLFIAGELSGIALIRHAIAQAVAAVDEVARRRTTLRTGGAEAAVEEGHGSREPPVDLLIVGAGPAGLAASLRAIEVGLSHRLLEQDALGGTLLHYPRAKLVMTQPVELPLLGRLSRSEYRKEELVELFDEAVRTHPIELRDRTRVTAVRRVEGAAPHFRVTAEGARGSEEFRAGAVLLALGRRGSPRRLEVPGEERTKVAYRLIDAALHRDQHLLVVGGGDSAIEAALALAEQPGNRVTLSYRKERLFRLKPRNQQRFDAALAAGRVTAHFSSRVVEIGEHDVTLAIATAPDAERTIRPCNDLVFVFAGGDPPLRLLQEAGVAFPT